MRIVLMCLTAGLLPQAALAEPGKAKSCVALNRVTEQRIADASTVYYKEGARWYRNDLGAACPGLDATKSLSSRTPTASLCEGDIVTVFRASNSFEYGSCPLGRFTRVDGPPQRGERAGR